MPNSAGWRGEVKNQASVSGRQRKKWSAGGETAGTEPERNAAAEPMTEAVRDCVLSSHAGTSGWEMTEGGPERIERGCRVSSRPLVPTVSPIGVFNEMPVIKNLPSVKTVRFWGSWIERTVKEDA